LVWRQNSIPISCPQYLQRFGTRFSEFHAELDGLTLLQTPLHFRPLQDTKTTTHFAKVPTATKARTQLRKVQLYTRVPPPPASTHIFLSWPFCAAQKNHSHYFWDRLRTLQPGWARNDGLITLHTERSFLQSRCVSLLNEKVLTNYWRNRPVGSGSRLHRHITHKDEDGSLPVFRFLQVHKSHWSYSPVLKMIYVTTTIDILVSIASSIIN
jgi:hypothetical protein